METAIQYRPLTIVSRIRNSSLAILLFSIILPGLVYYLFGQIGFFSWDVSFLEGPFPDPQNGLTSHALDQPGAFKFFFWTAFLSFTTLPMMAAIRLFSYRTRWTLVLAHGIPAFFLALMIMRLLTEGAVILHWYIRDMGHTSARDTAAFYAGCFYVLLTAYMIWSLWPPRNKEKTMHQDKVCPDA